jgi:hypothetical protein
MKKNMGTVDKAIRILAAIIIAVLYFTNVISGTVAIMLGVLAIIFIFTSFISICPLYLLFGIHTNKRKMGGRILNGWNLSRMLRLAMGTYILVMGIISNDWFVALIGGLLVVMPVLNIGCCGTSTCSVDLPKSNSRSADQMKNNNLPNNIEKQ